MKIGYMLNSFWKKNQNTILLALGVTGFIASNVMVAKATKETVEKLQALKEQKQRELTKKEKLIAVAPKYVAPLAMSVASASMIFAGNKGFLTTQAGLISSYGALKKKYENYQDVIVQKIGKAAEEEALKDYISERYREGKITTVGEGHILCCDVTTPEPQFFEITPLELVDAKYQLNYLFNTVGKVYLNQYYDMVGLPQTEDGNVRGWSWMTMDCVDWIELLEELDHDDHGNEFYTIRLPEPDVIF